MVCVPHACHIRFVLLERSAQRRDPQHAATMGCCCSKKVDPKHFDHEAQNAAAAAADRAQTAAEEAKARAEALWKERNAGPPPSPR